MDDLLTNHSNDKLSPNKIGNYNLDIHICFTRIGPKVVSDFAGTFFLDKFEKEVAKSSIKPPLYSSLSL